MESVSWPPGRYEIGANGRVFCDGTYIGQSVHLLATAVAHWRRTLPSSHRVSAVVVVHPAAEGPVALPSPPPAGGWSLAQDAVHHIGHRLTPFTWPSDAVVAQLVTATDDPV